VRARYCGYDEVAWPARSPIREIGHAGDPHRREARRSGALLAAVRLVAALMWSMSIAVLAVEGGEPVRIGVNVAATGEAAAVNSVAITAARFAAEEVNREGGIHGRRLEVVVYDNRSSVIGAKSAAERATDDDVVAVVGCMRSSFSLAAAQVLQPAGVPLVSPMATHPDVTAVGDLIFRVCYVDAFQGELLATYAYETLALKRASVLVNSNRIYSTGLGRIFSQRFEQSGGEVVYAGEYFDGTVDFTNHLAAMAVREPSVLLIPAEVQEAAFVIRQAHRRGIQVQFLGPDSWNDDLADFVGAEAIEGATFSDHWHREVDTPSSRAFVTAWEAAHPSRAGSGAALTYDAVSAVVQALRASEAGAGRGAVGMALRRVDFAGVTGRIRFDEGGDPVGKAAVIMRFEDGRATYHATFADRETAE